MCTSKYDVRLEEIFNKPGTYKETRTCTEGGCTPDVVVEFRPNKDAYGTFGFDWLRVNDTNLNLETSDVRYTTNIGNHYKKKVENGKYVKDTICTDDTDITTPVGTIFETDETMQKALLGEFETLVKLTPINVDDPKTKNIDESLNNIVPALQKNFRYVIPVITLMPKDKEEVEEADKKNPYNINLEALLDVNVYLGKIKPTALKLGFDATVHETRIIDGVEIEITDEYIFNQACKIEKMNLFKESKEGHIKITSIGTLHKDITVYVYASNNLGKNHICGAFKVLRNNVVKEVTVHYMGTKVDAEVDETNVRVTPKEKQPPIIDMKLRSILGQALINIKQVVTATPVILDMRGKLEWETIMVHNENFNPKKMPHPTKNPKLKAKKGLDADIVMELLELEYYNQYLRFQYNPSNGIDESMTEIYDGTQFPNLRGQRVYKSVLSKTKIHQGPSHPELIGKSVYTNEYFAIKGLYPTDIYRCYFFADRGLSRRYKVKAVGGGRRGGRTSAFYAENEVDASTLAHEVGHNLNLGHTFSQPTSHPYVYKYLSTDNIMDYVDGNVFYYGQWKIMNPEGIS